MNEKQIFGLFSAYGAPVWPHRTIQYASVKGLHAPKLDSDLFSDEAYV